MERTGSGSVTKAMMRIEAPRPRFARCPGRRAAGHRDPLESSHGTWEISRQTCWPRGRILGTEGPAWKGRATRRPTPPTA